MMQITEQYLIFLQETEDGYITEAPVAAAAGKAAQAAATAGKAAGVAGTLGKFAAAASPYITAAAAATYAIKLANFAYKNTIDKAHKTCRGLDSESYTLCVRKFKLKAYMEQLRAMKNVISDKCSKAKKPDECKANIQKKMEKVKARIDALKEQLKADEERRLEKARAAGRAQAGAE